MAEIIEEVPIADAESAPVQEEPAVVEVPAEAAPKKRGRPPGAKNRPKAKTEARPAPAREASPPKRSAKRGSKAAEPRKAPPESESEEEPPPKSAKRGSGAAQRRARSVPEVPKEQSQDSVSPEPLDTRAIAAEVLHLLSNRHVERAAQKREKYRSWFQ